VAWASKGQERSKRSGANLKRGGFQPAGSCEQTQLTNNAQGGSLRGSRPSRCATGRGPSPLPPSRCPFRFARVKQLFPCSDAVDPCDLTGQENH